jgi:hypothetical protein
MTAFKCKLEKYVRTCSGGSFSVETHIFFIIILQCGRASRSRRLLIKIQIVSSLNLFLPSETRASRRGEKADALVGALIARE